MRPTVTIQVVLYRSARHQPRLVAGLQHLEADVDWQVRFLDNAPDDGCEALLRRLQPSFPYSITASPRGNIGFGAGHNLLAERAESAYLWFLNPDTVPFWDCLARLVARAEAVPRAGLVEAAQFPVEHPKAYDPESHCTNWCSGACLLARTGVLRDLGGFDPRLFLYCEDVDLSWRCWMAGRECHYLPQARCVHVTQEHDTGKDRSIEQRWMHVGALFLRARHFGDAEVEQYLGELSGSLDPGLLADVRAAFDAIRPREPAVPPHPRMSLANAGVYGDARW